MTESSEFSPEIASRASAFQERPLMPEKEAEAVGKIRHWEEQFAKLANEPARNIFKQTEEIRDKHVGLEKETVKTMADSDPEIREKQDALEGLAKTLRRIHEDAARGNWLTDTELKEKLEVFSDVIALVQSYQQSQATRNIAGPIRQISLPLSTHSLRGITTAVEKLTTLCENPRTIWHHLVEQNVVTAEFIEEKDLITDLILIKKQQDLIEENKHLFTNEQIRALRAKTLVPLLDKNINLVLLDEALEGRFVFEEDYAKEVISAFLSLKEEIEETSQKKKRKLTKREKMARAATIGMLSGMLLLPSSSYQPLEQLVESPKTAKELGSDEKLIPPELEQQSSPTTPDYNEIVKPVVDSAEAFVGASKINVWDLGRNIPGYFRTATAAEFRGDDITWRKDWFVGRRAEKIEPEQKPDVMMQAFFPKPASVFELAVPYGYTVDPKNSKFFIDGQLLIRYENYDIFRSNEGNTFAVDVFRADKLTGQVELQVALVKASENDFPKDQLNRLDEDELKKLTSKHLEIKKLPHDVQNLLTQANDASLTPQEKGKLFEAYIQESLIYALEPR